MQTLDYASFGILHFICKREDSIQTVLKTVSLVRKLILLQQNAYIIRDFVLAYVTVCKQCTKMSKDSRDSLYNNAFIFLCSHSTIIDLHDKRRQSSCIVFFSVKITILDITKESAYITEAFLQV